MKNILILAALSAVILTGCGNISPPFKAEQTTVTTAAPTVSAAASSEAESTVDEEQVKYDTFIAEFFDSNICFSDTSALVTEAMKGCSFETQTDSSNGVQNISLKRNVVHQYGHKGRCGTKLWHYCKPILRLQCFCSRP